MRDCVQMSSMKKLCPSRWNEYTQSCSVEPSNRIDNPCNKQNYLNRVLTMSNINSYYDEKLIDDRIQAGDHRGLVGGMWDEIGLLQFEFVRDRGLTPDMNFLDVGCGCLRGGVHFVNYLHQNRYFGIDLSAQLIEAGYEKELSAQNLRGKLDRKNLSATGTFQVSDFETTFDRALALSVFTHLPLNHLKLCLYELGKSFTEGGEFYVSYFHAKDFESWTAEILHSPGNITTYPERDPFHYQERDLAAICQQTGWNLEAIEEWDHPRDQWMATFSKN